jgi:succinate-semialdehyde dehydrogenase / glutarate-semialdehyde dehydrogenase
MTTWADLKFERNYIDGAWVDADSGLTSEIKDPATRELLGHVPRCGTAETKRAIVAAAQAFPAWSRLTADTRAEHLLRLSSVILEEREPLAELLTREQGKPLAEARGEITMSAQYIRWFGEEARRVYGDVVPSPWPDRRILVTPHPVGVVGAITPWNFPSSMLARKIGPALAAGCTVVAKPAPQTPFSGLAWGWLAEQAGIPSGVLNIVTGDAEAIGLELTSNPTVSKITFTGSTRVGKLLLQQAASTVKRVSMELGGNAAFLVFDDANLDRAVEGAIAAKFRNSG